MRNWRRWLALASVVGAALTGISPEALADDAPKIDTGDTAWMLTSTALVLMMTIPGLALFYAGMVRKKNVLSTMMQSFAICSLITIVWAVAGYSLAFGNGGTFVGDFSRLFLDGIVWDKPGVIGAIGTVLGEAGINVSRMQVGLADDGKDAASLWALAAPIGEAVLSKVKNAHDVTAVHAVTFGS